MNLIHPVDNHGEEASFFAVHPGRDSTKLRQQVKEFIRTPRKLLIDGEWVNAASGRFFETFNPATGGVLTSVAEADTEDVDRAVTTAARPLTGPRASMTSANRKRWCR
jgi:hypothetical protein